jgi:hypothetical protein
MSAIPEQIIAEAAEYKFKPALEAKKPRSWLKTAARMPAARAGASSSALMTAARWWACLALGRRPAKSASQ